MVLPEYWKDGEDIEWEKEDTLSFQAELKYFVHHNIVQLRTDPSYSSWTVNKIAVILALRWEAIQRDHFYKFEDRGVYQEECIYLTKANW